MAGRAMGVTRNEGPAISSTTSNMPSAPVPTFGLTHLAIGVQDPARAFEFYRRVFGMIAVYSETDFVQAQTPGARDVLVFERRRSRAGRTGGVIHFGFRLRRPADIAVAVRAAVAAGGAVLQQGEFVAGEPYVFFKDPDGYEVEIWYELPSPLDPGRSRRKAAKRT